MDESKIILREIKQLEGSGTKNDPYVITTSDELAMINDDLDAYYILGNDIDLTKDTKEETGLFYNDSKGWIPIGAFDNLVFGGSLDGQGYTIKGLYKNNSNYNGGLFNEIGVTSNLEINIQNINFEDCYIKSTTTYYEGSPYYTSNEGLLAYSLSDLLKDYPTSSYYYLEVDVSININNISLTNSYISGYTFTGGLISIIDSSKEDSINISNIFSNSTIESSEKDKYTKGGIIGYVKVNNSLENDAAINISDILNIGNIIINSSLDTTYYSGSIIGMSYGKMNLNNIISITKAIDDNTENENINYGSVVGKIGLATSHTGISTLTNIYYTDNYDPVYTKPNSITLNNVLKKIY